MKRNLLIILVGLVLMGLTLVTQGCDGYVKSQELPPLPKELQDCKMFEVGTGWRTIYVMRCPSSVTSTTWQAGKVTMHAITIDGVEYVPKQ